MNNRERKGEGRLNRNIKIEEEQWYFPKLDGEENIISCTSICKFKLPQYEMYIQMRFSCSRNEILKYFKLL